MPAQPCSLFNWTANGASPPISKETHPVSDCNLTNVPQSLLISCYNVCSCFHGQWPLVINCKEDIRSARHVLHHFSGQIWKLLSFLPNSASSFNLELVPMCAWQVFIKKGTLIKCMWFANAIKLYKNLLTCPPKLAILYWREVNFKCFTKYVFGYFISV